MSNQGNIVVNLDGKEIILTTGRWAGDATPRTVQYALHDGAGALDTDWKVLRHFLWCLLHSASEETGAGLYPVFVIGNSDTPTVYVFWTERRVQLVWDHTKEVVGDYSFEEFTKLDMDAVWRDEHGYQ